MSLVTVINNFFRLAGADDVQKVKNRIVLSERQETIFELYYLKKKNVNFIADTLFVCPQVINKELKIIREKIYKSVDLPK